MECERKSDTTNYRGDWNHFKITQKYLSNTPGKHEIKELKKPAIMDTAHILQKVLI